MAELNLKQIIDRLNAEFTGETRKLVFWYDDKAEFEEDMKTVELQNAKIYLLQKDNQFYTKYFLERQDTENNYLIYAPFPKPEVKDNHLEDTMLYSKRFFADRASLLSVDLGIEEKYKPIIEKHIKFFANKDRTQRFYDLEIENFNEENIIVGLLSAICKTRTCSFEEVLRIVLMESDIEENTFLEEFAKYDLYDSFWKLCEQQFGYRDDSPSLERFVVTMFVTYTDRYLVGSVPKPWSSFVSLKQGNIIAFLDNLMNSVLYCEDYDALSDHVADGLHIVDAFAKYNPEDLIHLETFAYVDEIILKWIADRLVAEDIGAKLDDMSIIQICNMRSKMHFGEKYADAYTMLRNAFDLVSSANYGGDDNFKNIVKKYGEQDCLIDFSYRKFYYYYDKLEDTTGYESLQTLVENIYVNEYLGNLIPRWNQGFAGEDGLVVLHLQRNFYKSYVNQTKERTVVIISDAMRYEVGRELFLKMQDDPHCTAKISMMMSSLPSCTKLGMAALLPHNTLEFTDNYDVLVDGLPTKSREDREKILQQHCQDSVCVKFDEVKSLKKNELREVFTGKQVIYVYHDQIDARGHKMPTENETFQACEEAITEIIDFIRRISTNANTYRFLITADHGFLYRYTKPDKTDTIASANFKNAVITRRYMLSSEKIEEVGVDSRGLGELLGNDDSRFVSYPVSGKIFETSGTMRFEHGGSSPQEMIIPLIDIKMERGHMETKPVQISLVSMVQKITNLITSMDFIQSEPVSDTVKATTYRIVFMSEDDEKISNENTYVADSREPDSQKRIFRMRFNFKNQKYDKSKQYYLVVIDTNTGLEQFRHPVIMDLTFGDDFGF